MKQHLLTPVHDAKQNDSDDERLTIVTFHVQAATLGVVLVLISD